ncbi:hypothetical protein [Streptomyces fagopyri]|uniref:hypothetical protein n=1 Tax=Streptomyces fagopyri TaxID=2662397 RepID=UPI0038114589
MITETVGVAIFAFSKQGGAPPFCLAWRSPYAEVRAISGNMCRLSCEGTVSRLCLQGKSKVKEWLAERDE